MLQSTLVQKNAGGVLAGILLIVLVAAVPARAVLFEDFDDQNDLDTLTRVSQIDELVGGGPYVQWSTPAVTGGYGYRIVASASPDPLTYGPGRGGSWDASTRYTDFVVSVDVVDWALGIDQGFGLTARLQQVGGGTSDGYTFGINTAVGLVIARQDDDVLTALQVVPFALTPGKSYRLVFEGRGSELIGTVYDADDPGLAMLGSVTATDATYKLGYLGLGVIDSSALGDDGADATFDDFLIRGGSSYEVDAPLLALVDTLRPLAEMIMIDGDDTDWSAIPLFDDADNDLHPPDPTREIVDAKIAPLADSLLFLAHTAGAPAPGAFGVTADIGRGPAVDFLILLGPPHFLILYDDDNEPLHEFPQDPPRVPPLPLPIDISAGGIEFDDGANLVEVKVPYTAFQTHLSSELQAELTSAPRSFVRGGVVGGIALTKPDLGGGGSFRLIDTPYALDPPFRPPPGTRPAGVPTPLEMPLRGQWLIAQGPFGFVSHMLYWGLDFTRLDADGRISNPPNGLLNTDYYSFGEPIFSPLVGTVFDLWETEEDNPPTISRSEAGTKFWNFVTITDGAVQVRMGHLIENSIPVVTSQAVDPSTKVGLVGNSGFTIKPHLHLEAMTTAAFPFRPTALELVDVSLNDEPDDPWRRTIAGWEPREGFLVGLPVVSSVPALATGPRMALVAMVTLVAVLAMARRTASRRPRRSA